MPHTTTNLLVHSIFSTKQRCALIKPEFEKDLHAYLGGIVRQIGGTALCVNGTRDHVHLLIRVPINRSVADIARLIKTNSSRWIHERWPEYHLFAWQTGYGAFTVSESGIRRRSGLHSPSAGASQGEVVSRGIFGVKKNGITVDERYLWD